jgi:hypothetical protein
MAEPDLLGQKLDLLIALTRIGVSHALQREREVLAADPVSVELIKRCRETTPAGALKDAVLKATGKGKATVERRMADLVSRGVLIREGSGGQVTYRSSGLFEL